MRVAWNFTLDWVTYGITKWTNPVVYLTRTNEGGIQVL